MQTNPKTARAVESENTQLWNSLVDTPPEYLKEFKRAGGFGGKSIDPTYRIRKLTEVFGPVGKGWGFVQEDQWSDGGSGSYVVYVRGHLWYLLDGERYLTNSHTGGTVCDRAPDEAYKMAETDALGKCCVDLGLSCDVYMGEHDGDKYQQREDGKTYRHNPEAAGRRPAGNKPTEAPQAQAARREYRPIVPEEMEAIGAGIRASKTEEQAIECSKELFHRLLASSETLEQKDKKLLVQSMSATRCQLVGSVDGIGNLKKYLDAMVKQKWLTETEAKKYVSLVERRLSVPPQANES